MIEPFGFPKNLQEGGRAQVTCAVSSGDLPIVFTWKKDDHLLPASLQVTFIFNINNFVCLSETRILNTIRLINSQITAKGDEFFSMLIFKDISARHSGKYTCYASNSAATVNHTSELLVKGKWLTFING